MRWCLYLSFSSGFREALNQTSFACLVNDYIMITMELFSARVSGVSSEKPAHKNSGATVYTWVFVLGIWLRLCELPRQPLKSGPSFKRRPQCFVQSLARTHRWIANATLPSSSTWTLLASQQSGVKWNVSVHTNFHDTVGIKLIASPNYLDKRIGYLAVNILLDENQEVLMLATHQIKTYVVCCELLTVKGFETLEQVYCRFGFVYSWKHCLWANLQRLCSWNRATHERRPRRSLY